MLGVKDTCRNDCLEADSRKNLPVKMSCHCPFIYLVHLYLMAGHIQAAEAGPVFTVSCLQQDLRFKGTVAPD
jgi:hypothetical protein